MGEPLLTWRFASEQALTAAAGACARLWADLGPTTVCIGLIGDLGAGKTTWVRGMLRGLGYRGRVPSPTYTLVEPYKIQDIQLVHVDLYRLSSGVELESLGLRDYLQEPGTWLLIEWPDRHEPLVASCDLRLEFAWTSSGRAVDVVAQSAAGRQMSAKLTNHIDSSNDS